MFRVQHAICLAVAAIVCGCVLGQYERPTNAINLNEQLFQVNRTSTDEAVLFDYIVKETNVYARAGCITLMRSVCSNNANFLVDKLVRGSNEEKEWSAVVLAGMDSQEGVQLVASYYVSKLGQSDYQPVCMPLGMFSPPVWHSWATMTTNGIRMRVEVTPVYSRIVAMGTNALGPLRRKMQEGNPEEQFAARKLIETIEKNERGP